MTATEQALVERMEQLAADLQAFRQAEEGMETEDAVACVRVLSEACADAADELESIAQRVRLGIFIP